MLNNIQDFQLLNQPMKTVYSTQQINRLLIQKSKFSQFFTFLIRFEDQFGFSINFGLDFFFVGLRRWLWTSSFVGCFNFGLNFGMSFSFLQVCFDFAFELWISFPFFVGSLRLQLWTFGNLFFLQILFDFGLRPLDILYFSFLQVLLFDFGLWPLDIFLQFLFDFGIRFWDFFFKSYPGGEQFALTSSILV